ncbi:DUF2023 family protein [Pontiella agarivorans]|uniref:DUF2023 family protein n=1 Tax=Pontiella agarivorans TaxID=3038953 RepID=A0ABU5MVK2_9BACT|nr:DUF2023 family protein [Pontiella agarivorans]MDZ8118157.1 DUF2023 family protein [Pontiella agarivorans]
MSMQVFGHHVYEYRKGLRNLVLHTVHIDELEAAIHRLDIADIEYQTYPVKNTDRVNIFFGARDSVEVIRVIGKEDLNEYTPEEDFMLGTMLGYDRRQQCERYLEQRAKWEKRQARLAEKQ